MAKKRIPVVVMQAKDFRKPDSFIFDIGSRWDEFLKRWNDPNITTDEARGLLHTVTDRLYWTDFGREDIGEDSRETCVRFLLHYADYPYRFDCEWQIVEKTRQVLIFKILDTGYMREEASDELVMDILIHLLKYFKTDYNQEESYRRKIESFLRMINETRNNHKISELVDKFIVILFRIKHRRKKGM